MHQLIAGQRAAEHFSGTSSMIPDRSREGSRGPARLDTGKFSMPRCDLGFHPIADLAMDAVVRGAVTGWPHSPRYPSERYRKLYDAPDLPAWVKIHGNSTKLTQWHPSRGCHQ
jgi:hypothetical protein